MRSTPPCIGDAASWYTRLWLFQQRAGLGVRAAVWTTELKGKESWKMHTLNARGWERNNGSPTSWHLSLFLTWHQGKPLWGCGTLGLWLVRAQILLLFTAGGFWPLWWKQNGQNCYTSVKLDWITDLKASHMQRSHVLACSTKIIFEFKAKQTKLSVMCYQKQSCHWFHWLHPA